MDLEAVDIRKAAAGQEQTKRPDPGIMCLAALLRFHGLPADPEALTHQVGAGEVSATQDDLVRLARRQGLKAKAVIGKNWTSLLKTHLPAIARRVDGEGFVIVAKVAEDKALIQDGRTMRPGPLPGAVSRRSGMAVWC